MGIFPYIYFMVEDFHVAKEAKTISLYAGMVTSAFTFAEFLSGVFWGRLSDRIGRKPVLLIGLLGTALSVLIFGFAPSLGVALFARFLGGLLNGNMGVLATTVNELVKVKDHEARAYIVMPTAWGLGSIIGPVIGGLLARPCYFYPEVFRPGSVWDRFPYLLPNLFSAGAVCISVVIGILFLEETHAERKKERDRGCELGDRLLSGIWWRKVKPTKAQMDEEQPLLRAEDQLPGYRTSGNLRQALVATNTETPVRTSDSTKKTKGKVFTKNIILNIASFGILAFHTMTFDQLFPVFLSTAPPEGGKPVVSSPLKFIGGFGYDNQEIGVVIAVQGFYSLIASWYIFPWAVRRLGELRLFQLLAALYFLHYMATPYLVLLPGRVWQEVGIYAVIFWKCTFSTLAYPSNVILTKNAVPSSLWMGTIMGFHASAASLCRAFGPTVSGFLFTIGLETGYSGLAWWCSGLVALVGSVVAMNLTDARETLVEKFDEDDQTRIALPTATTTPEA